MNTYQKWLQSEKEWIDIYGRKVRRRIFHVTIPLTLAGTTILFGAMSALKGGMETLLYGILGGFVLGALICGICLLVLLPGLSPDLHISKIEKSIRALSFDEAEKELLAEEMLKADEKQKISYTLDGPGCKGTPARFVLTAHYAFLEGSSPYSIIIRLSDIAWINMSEERKTATERQGNSKTIYRFTLYTIGFYRKDRLERGSAETGLPDQAFGFFSAELREQVIELLKETGIEMR